MTADTVGGVWTFSLDLMAALRGSGIDFALATMGPPPNAQQRAALGRIGNVTLHESAFKLEWMENPWADVDEAGRWLLDVAEHFQPDMIHLNGYAHGDLPWRRPVLMVAHSCVYSWYTAVKNQPPPASWTTYRERVTRGLAAATAVTAPTEAMLANVRRHYDGSFRAIAPIHNGRSQSLFRSAPKKEPSIVTAGRLWDEAKNIRLLEEAAPSVDWPICIAGETRRPEGGETAFRCLKQLGILSPEMFAEQLSRAAIYALPARYEPFGLTALEAALSGCALVLADIPSLREVWADAAVFVSPHNVAGWSGTLNRLARDRALRESLARRALLRGEHFTTKRMAEEYLRAYLKTRDDHQHCYEDRSLLSFTPVGLESRQRPLPSRLRH